MIGQMAAVSMSILEQYQSSARRSTLTQLLALGIQMVVVSLLLEAQSQS